MSGEWTVIESTAMEGEGEGAITDVCLLTKKEKAPSGYTVVRSGDSYSSSQHLRCDLCTCTDRLFFHSR